MVHVSSYGTTGSLPVCRYTQFDVSGGSQATDGSAEPRLVHIPVCSGRVTTLLSRYSLFIFIAVVGKRSIAR